MTTRKGIFWPFLLAGALWLEASYYAGALNGAKSPGGEVGALPRVFLLDAKSLRERKDTLAKKGGSKHPSVSKLLARADSALIAPALSVMNKQRVAPSGDKHDFLTMSTTWWPDPKAPKGSPYIYIDGKVNPEAEFYGDRKNLDTTISNLSVLAQAYYLVGDEKYAEKAVELIRAWFLDARTRMNPHLKYASAVPGTKEGKASGILETRGFTQVVDAAGLLEGSPAWKEEDKRGLVEWFGQFLDWLLNSDYGKREARMQNNHGTWYDVQTASIALFVSRKEIARQIIEESKSRRIEAQIGKDGSFPEEISRTKSLEYSLFNLDALTSLAMLGEQAGIDLWHFTTSDGRGIKLALDYILPYALKKKAWPHSQIKEANLSNTLYRILSRTVRVYPDSEYVAARNEVEREINRANSNT